MENIWFPIAVKIIDLLWEAEEPKVQAALMDELKALETKYGSDPVLDYFIKIGEAVVGAVPDSIPAA